MTFLIEIAVSDLNLCISSCLPSDLNTDFVLKECKDYRLCVCHKLDRSTCQMS